MKKITLLSTFIMLVFTIAMSQGKYPSTPEYEYTILQAIDGTDSYVVQYSNTGEIVRLTELLKINGKTESFGESIFKCFNYLNSQGYELVCSTNGPTLEDKVFVLAVAGEKCEYIFKRPKQATNSTH